LLGLLQLLELFVCRHDNAHHITSLMVVFPAADAGPDVITGPSADN